MKLAPYLLRNTYWIKDYLNGSPIRCHYNDIHNILSNPSKGINRKAKLLNQILEHATQNCPFYQSLSSSEIQDFPVVNKSILTSHYDDIKVAADKIVWQNGPIFIQKTSGSTGTPFAVPQDTRKRQRRIAELKYFGEKSGYQSHEKLVHLRTWNRWQTKTKLQALRENIIPFNISKIGQGQLKELCDIIKRRKVSALRGYASSIDLLANYVAEHKISLPSLKIIIAGSESLQDSTRTLVKTHIHCNIISQYANEENGILAQEDLSDDIERPFFINHASYYFELLKLTDDIPAEYGELGRIVLTDLFNYAFPMIRYDTGDTAIMLKEAPGSNGYPVILKLYGRRLDLVYDTKGDVVYPMSIARILKHYSSIMQWQFIQSSRFDYLLKLTVREYLSDEDEIKKTLLELFGNDAVIQFQLVDEIPILASGKRKPVVNNWEK